LTTTTARRRFAVSSCAIAASLSIIGCASVGTAPAAPTLQARVKPMLMIDGLKFKDSNANGKLDAYEDWRHPIDARVADLVAQMTLEEKAGLMLIQTLNGGCGGAPQPNAAAFVNQQQMHRFIIRNVVNAQGTCGGEAGSRAARN
jgi:beta-glucosidase